MSLLIVGVDVSFAFIYFQPWASDVIVFSEKRGSFQQLSECAEFNLFLAEMRKMNWTNLSIYWLSAIYELGINQRIKNTRLVLLFQL